jgi:thiol:disulfide interchange protein DsbG
MIKKHTILFAARGILLSTLALNALVLDARAEDWPAPIKALEAQGIEITDSFKAPDGLTGYVGLVGMQPLSIYLTSDGKHAIVGPMFDEQGHNLSQKPIEELVSKPMTEKVWQQLEQSTWIADGKENAPRVVYVFTDPNCPYCNKFWKEARPWVESGKVQLRHIMVAILEPSSPTKAAAILTAKSPQKALEQFEENYASGDGKALREVPDKIGAELDANLKLMQKIGAQATPTIFYKDANGLLQKIQGAPPAENLSEVLGPR